MCFDKHEFFEWFEPELEDEDYSSMLVESVIDYGLKHQNASKDQFCGFLAEILPEIRFRDIAAFAHDEILTEFGKREKYNFWEEECILLETRCVIADEAGEPINDVEKLSEVLAMDRLY